MQTLRPTLDMGELAPHRATLPSLLGQLPWLPRLRLVLWLSCLFSILLFLFEITFDALLAHLASLYFASHLTSLCFSFEITFDTLLTR